MTELQGLIKEAFINPIRSVLIVDDQYPTWEEILNQQLPEDIRDQELNKRSATKTWRNDSASALAIINQFRKQNPKLIIDIHDASHIPDTKEATRGEEADAASKLASPEPNADHLHQSDLLILDYNLEGASSGLEGRLARRILNSVLQNQHFNLVVVHTQEADLKEVFYNCIISLISPFFSSFEKHQTLIEKVGKRLEELADDEEFNAKELGDYFDLETYLKLRHPSTSCKAAFSEYMKGSGILSRLHEWAEKLGLKNGEKIGFVYWAIEQFEKSRKDSFANFALEGLDWAKEEGRLWLRTGRGFVTFVKKDHQDLLGELQLSLQAWKPSPSRLLSAKVRHEISCNGVEAEDRTLSKSHVFAYFYSLISKAGSDVSRAALIREHLNRQTETLTYQIAPAIVRFGEQIFSADSSTGEKFASHYNVDLSDKVTERFAASHFNSYISTLPLISGDDHLDCGHIFQINNEWWVCATPACDMEPGQNTIAFVGTSNELRPFTALKLNEVKEDLLTDRHINTGLYCFAEVAPGSIKCLGLLALGNENDPDLGSEKVTWRTFIAKNDGRLKDGKLDLVRPKLNAEKVDLSAGTANVLAKLRYEYALNYIQKVGASVTRIGLGYRSDSFSK